MPSRNRITYVAVCLLAALLPGGSALALTIGPDAFGYHATDEVIYEWEEIAPAAGGSGTELNNGAWIGDIDDGYQAIPIGFNFFFYGNVRSNLYVTSNGFLLFDTTGGAIQYSNDPIPYGSPPDRFIAPFWDDLDIGENAGEARVCYRTLGSAPTRRLVVEYYRIPHVEDPTSRYTFAATLYEVSGSIKCQYSTMVNDRTNYADGGSATLGIEDGSGTNGVEWSFNASNTVSNGFAVLYYLPSDIELTKRVTTPPPRVGERAGFTVVLSNRGPWAVGAIVVTDGVPSALSSPWVVPSAGVFLNDLWAVPLLLPGAAAQLAITGVVNAAGVITNTAEVVVSLPPDSDATPNNHDPLEDDQDSAVVTTRWPRLVVHGTPAQHDAPSPFPYGTNDAPVLGTILTNTVTSPADEAGGTRYVSAGWGGQFILPTSGPGPSAVFTMWDDADLTHYWATEHYLSLTGVNGSISGATEGWKSAGFIYALTPSADPGFFFDHWETNGAAGGATVPLSVTMDGPKQVRAVCVPGSAGGFTNVTSNTTASFIAWVTNRQYGTLFGTLELCNRADSTKVMTGPFWYAVQPTADVRLWTNVRAVATMADGKEYVDISGDVYAALPFVGNGDQGLDPGECVVVSNIEFYFRQRVPVVGMVYAVWADPPGAPAGGAADTDGDGLPDAWEDEHGLNRNNPFDALQDADADGVVSLDEYRSDTDPRNAASYLRMLNLGPGEDGLRVEWVGGTVVSQYLFWVDALGRPWLCLYTNVPPTERTNVFDHRARDGAAGFYRIQTGR